MQQLKLPNIPWKNNVPSTISFHTFIDNARYKWRLPHGPSFDALSDGKGKYDDEVVYIDLTSAYHFLDPSNRGEMENIHEIKTLVKSL